MAKLNSSIPVYIDRGMCITPLGFSLDENRDEIENYQSAIQLHDNKDFWDKSFYGGLIAEEKINNAFFDLKQLGEYSKLEKLLIMVGHSLKEKYNPFFNERCGFILSTTKGNIDALSIADNSSYYLSELANKIGAILGIPTQPIVLSNACVSGIMAVSVAKRLIQTGAYDHFLVLGGDVFSKFVFSGFQAFQAVSDEPCKPYDKDRTGITLGEAVAGVFISKDKTAVEENNIVFQIMGDSSINDANHISGPSRTGEGLYLSIRNALMEAEVSSTEIDSLSSHGTATNYNDEMEAQAFHRANLQNVPTYSLKGYYGHTLGAAGLIETIIALEFARQNKIPCSLNYKTQGTTLPLNITQKVLEKNVCHILKTASGFGGSNTAVVFRKIEIKNNGE